MTTISLTEGDRLRDEALARVASTPSGESIVEQALTAIERMSPGAEFTTDDLWPYVEAPNGAEPRAMGAAVRKASTAQLIEPTGRQRKSTHKVCHSRPKAVWRRR